MSLTGEQLASVALLSFPAAGMRTGFIVVSEKGEWKMARNISLYEPISDLMSARMFPDIERFLKEFSMPPALRDLQSRMKLDVEETSQNYLVKAEIPGVSKDDISIDISGNAVSIRAEVKEERSEKPAGNVLYTERYYGEQMRSFTLPQEVDESKADAKYENGILSLTLPKKAPATSKKLEVH